MFRTPLFVPFVAVTAAIFSPLLPAQTVDGRRAIEKPGLALVKPQAWSSAEQATVVEFTAYTDRSGYFEFKTSRSPAYQVPAARMVKMVVYPDPVPELVTASQRAALQKAIDDLTAVAALNGSAKRLLDPYIGSLRDDAGKFDSGNVKEAGTWKTKSSFYRQKADQLVVALKAEMNAAPKIENYNLEESSLYTGLVELAKEEPSLRPTVMGMKTDLEARKRAVRRAALLNEIKASDLTMVRAQAIVAELKTLQPAEDREASGFLARWDAALAAASDVTKRIEDTRENFEKAVAAVDEANPKFPGALVTEVVEAATVADTFQKNAPPALKIPADTARAMNAMVTAVPDAYGKIKAKSLFEAKDLVDPLAAKAMTIGPKSVGAVSALQQTINDGIGSFTRLRDEANLFLSNKKPADALKKFEEAYAIIPTPEMKAQIDTLRKPQS